MATYSIRDLEKISGIKAHTIRIWERRYKLIEPSRTSTNIRYYSDDDLKLILNVSILNQNGVKISKIAELSDEQMRQRVLDLCLDTKNSDVQIENLLVAMLEMDEVKYSSVISNSILKLGFEATCEQIIFPFLERVGILWQAGTITPSQEHFISNLIRQKLIVAIDNEMQNSVNQTNKCILFFLPENEWHELGLLFYSLIARKLGYKVLYLGAAVPMEDLKTVTETQVIHVLFTSYVSALEKEKLEESLQFILKEVPNLPLFITGLQLRMLNPKMPQGTYAISSIGVFKEKLANL